MISKEDCGAAVYECARSAYRAIVPGPVQQLVWRWRTGREFSPHLVKATLGGVEPVFFVFNGISTFSCAGMVDEGPALVDLLGRLRSCDTFWDVGAAFGTYTVSAALRGANVVAIEPDPRLRQLIRINMGYNGLGWDRIRLQGVALGSSPGRCVLHSDGERGGAPSLRPNGQGGRVEVSVTTGDLLVAGGDASEPDVVKIDVEGAECEVLRGMRGLLNGARLRHIYLEIHPTLLPKFGHSVRDVIGELGVHGFVMESSVRRGTEFLTHWVCSRG